MASRLPTFEEWLEENYEHEELEELVDIEEWILDLLREDYESELDSYHSSIAEEGWRDARVRNSL